MIISRITKALLRDRILALVVLVAMALHTYLKYRWGPLPERLWGCNIASFVIILGCGFLQKHFQGNWDSRLVFSTLMFSLLLGDWASAQVLHRSPRTA